MPREKILSSPVYWFDKAQNDLFRQFHYYMEGQNINQTQLAERLGITKGRVSQILQGESNFSMKTLIELGLSIGVIPKIKYVTIEDEIKADEEKKLEKQKFAAEKAKINYLFDTNETHDFKVFEFSQMLENHDILVKNADMQVVYSNPGFVNEYIPQSDYQGQEPQLQLIA